MWHQAKARAEEMGSMVLWCDGGEGGVSGVAGGGMTDFMQFGEGSWLRTIGVQWPFDETRTAYARRGGWYTLLVLWLVSGGLRLQNKMAAKGIRLVIRLWRERMAARLNARTGETQSLLD